LIDNGANVNAKSGGRTVLAITDNYYGSETEIVKLLKSHGATF
jgi:hypothetical protein